MAGFFLAGSSLCLVGAWGCGQSERHSATGRDVGAGGAAAGGTAHPGPATIGVGPEAGAGGDCERDVTLQGVVLEEPQPFDLVIVADHSKSLAWSKDELSSGLRDLLTNVRGRSVRVFLLTPTQYGADSAAAKMPTTGLPVVDWQDPETGDAYDGAVTSYTQVCTDPDGQAIDCPAPDGDVPYTVQGTWSFRAPDPVAVIRPGMTNEEFQAQKDAVRDAILAIGGTGSPHEQPLCTLDRYVSQQATALPKNAVFLLISDEDDISVPLDCLAGYQAELYMRQDIVATSPCTSNCNLYRYTMSGSTYKDGREASCATFTDTGELVADSEQPMLLYDELIESCNGYQERPCTDDERADADRYCPKGLSIFKCDRKCLTYDSTCRVDLTAADVDPCTGSFMVDEQMYLDLATYCAQFGSDYHDCAGQSLNAEYSPSLHGRYIPEPLVAGFTTSDLGNYFKDTAAQAFANGSYLLEGILLAPSFSCTLGAGQSYATNLMQLIGDDQHIFPLCESYEPALADVLDFAHTLLQTDYALALADDEHVTGVVVVSNDSSERSLAASEYSVDEEAGRLSIDVTALHDTDANLRVEISSDCRPAVR